MSIGRVLVFLAVISTLMASLHYYLWLRLVRDTALPPPFRLLATIALGLLCVSLPGSMILSRVLPGPLMRALTLPAFVWMGTLLLLLCALITTDVVRVLVWLAGVAGGGELVDPQRRVLFRRTLGALAAAASGVLSVRALQSGLAPVTVRRVEVPLARLPAAADGMTLVQLTDIHVGMATIQRGWMEELVARTNALAADVICITGDLVDGSVDELAHAVAPLAGLRARHGVYFVTGNHEYYAGAVEWERELARLGVRVLRNERVRIPCGPGGAGFDLAGVDDWSAHGQAPGHRADLPRALAGRNPEDECVLMAHQPRQALEAAQLGVGLQLSGHTHGGQIWPWGFAVRLQQGFLAGLTRVGDTWLYTSKGTGYWGPPMRLGADAEITQVVLRAARPA